MVGCDVQSTYAHDIDAMRAAGSERSHGRPYQSKWDDVGGLFR